MEPKVDTHLVTKFIPALMSLIVDDQVRSFNAKLPEEERETAAIVIDHSGPPPEAFQHYCEENTVAATLAMHYTLQTSKNKDKTGIMRVLGILANSVKSHPFEDVFLHCLITDLIKVTRQHSIFRNHIFSMVHCLCNNSPLATVLSPPIQFTFPASALFNDYVCQRIWK